MDDDLIEYCPEEEGSSANQFHKNAYFFYCSKCKAFFHSRNEFRRHEGLEHSEWRPVVLSQSGARSVHVIYVCSICCRHYELSEDLRGHMIEFHKYQPMEQQLKEVETAIISSKLRDEIANKPDSYALSKVDDTADNTEPPAVSDTASTLASVLELRPLPFKDFRLLLRAKMLLRCSASSSCAYKFETAAKLESHVRCHIAEMAKNKFKCSACGLELTNWRSCSLHLWKVHQEDVDLLHCPICEFKAHASVLVWRHMRFHKKWRARVIKSLRAVREKRQLVATKHNATEAPKPAEAIKTKYYAEKVCEICSRKFVNGKTLSKHVKSVHNKIKPFICNVCGKQMARKAGLIVHMRQHTGEKPLQCQTCNFATRDPSVLKKHKMRHENGGKHSCNCCDYVCIQTNAYKRHMRLNHPEEFKKISCDLCTFVTITEQRLQAHMEDHRKGLILNVEGNEEDSQDAAIANTFKYPREQSDKNASNADISTDYLLPLESVDSLPHEPTVDTGGVTIPAPSEDTQFPTYLNN